MLFIPAIPVWILSSLSVFIFFETAGVLTSALIFFSIFVAFVIYAKIVIPRLTKANGEGRLYEYFMEIQLHDKTFQIYYKDINQLEFSPTLGKRRVPYILIAEKEWQLKISMVQLLSYLDAETVRFEALFHAIRKKMNRDVEKHERLIFGISECITYRAIPQ